MKYDDAVIFFEGLDTHADIFFKRLTYSAFAEYVHRSQSACKKNMLKEGKKTCFIYVSILLYKQ